MHNAQLGGKSEMFKEYFGLSKIHIFKLLFRRQKLLIFIAVYVLKVSWRNKRIN